MKLHFFLTIPSLFFILFFSGASPASTSSPHFTQARQNFERVQKLILREHLGDVDEQILYRAATQGMLNALNKGNNRRWNKLMTPEELNELTVSLRSQVTGIGISIQFIPTTGTAYIQRVLKNSPAFASGLKIGDQILSVDGKLYRGLTQADISRDIRGPSGKSVDLKILRGDQILKKQIVRKKVSWGPVESKISSRNIGVLKIRSFTQNSPELVKAHLGKMRKVKGLVVDLRGNVGGILDRAVASTDHLLPKGKVIAMLRGRRGKMRIFRSENSPVIQVPMIVLVNGKTSAGAELMAVSLKENLGARLVGQNTYGKWNSQVIRRLPNNYAVKYTVHEFLSPGKHCYKGVGLAPDVAVRNEHPLAIPVGLASPSFSTKADFRKYDRQMQTALQLFQ